MTFVAFIVVLAAVAFAAWWIVEQMPVGQHANLECLLAQVPK